ncbi:MAG: peptide chain release factor N(5)-glutamine methyltransferase [Granulosicoccaceae bacterium]|jgi:release factor glutamine methyltransferase
MTEADTRIRALLNAASTELDAVSDSPRLDAECLLAHALGKPRSYLMTWPENQPDKQALQTFNALLARRLAGEPVAHLTGQREFWSLDLQISADTLIPRPDTETLVEAALAIIPAGATWRIADLGTGSGAIALAIASERPRCEVTACDLSVAALEIATANRDRLGLHNVTLLHSRWYSAFTDNDRFELIVSNPPYIAENDPHLARGDVRFEPGLALVSGPDGLDAIRSIISGAPRHLQAGGRLMLEHGLEQGNAVRELMQQAGFTQVTTLTDLEGRERVTWGQLAR